MRLLLLLLALPLLAQDAPLRILCIGDSITQGGRQDRPEHSYRLPLQRMLSEANIAFDFVGSRQHGLQAAEWPQPFDPDHEGYYGAKTATVRDSLATNLAALPAPDIALVHLGSNDQKAEDHRAAIYQPLREIVALLRARNPQVTVLIGHLNFNGGAALKIRPIVEELTALSSAKSRVTTVHHYKDWVAKPDLANTDTFDWAHPNPQGQRKMAEKWFAAMDLSSANGQYQKNLTMKSPSTGEDIIYTLYLPPGHSPAKGPYPLIIFLHGAGGANASAQVVDSYETARTAGLIPDCVLLFPERYGGTAWRDGRKDKMPETNILKELLPALNQKCALSTDRRDRAVMGFSMGAAGSLHWGSKYLDLFSVAVALDAGGGNSATDKDVRNYVAAFKEREAELQSGALAIRFVQGALNTRAFRAYLHDKKIAHDYVQIPKETEFYKTGSSCLNRRDPTRKMLHNPACLIEGEWGQDSWAFIGSQLSAARE